MDNSTAPPDHYVTTTDQDHGAFLWITSVNCLAYSLFALMGRFYVKWHKLGSDDAFISVSQVRYINGPLKIGRLTTAPPGRSRRTVHRLLLCNRKWPGEEFGNHYFAARAQMEQRTSSEPNTTPGIPRSRQMLHYTTSAPSLYTGLQDLLDRIQHRFGYLRCLGAGLDHRRICRLFS